MSQATPVGLAADALRPDATRTSPVADALRSDPGWVAGEPGSMWLTERIADVRAKTEQLATTPQEKTLLCKLGPLFDGGQIPDDVKDDVNQALNQALLKAFPVVEERPIFHSELRDNRTTLAITVNYHGWRDNPILDRLIVDTVASAVSSHRQSAVQPAQSAYARLGANEQWLIDQIADRAVNQANALSRTAEMSPQRAQIQEILAGVFLGSLAKEKAVEQLVALGIGASFAPIWARQASEPLAMATTPGTGPSGGEAGLQMTETQPTPTSPVAQPVAVSVPDGPYRTEWLKVAERLAGSGLSLTVEHKGAEVNVESHASTHTVNITVPLRYSPTAFAADLRYWTHQGEAGMALWNKLPEAFQTWVEEVAPSPTDSQQPAPPSETKVLPQAPPSVHFMPTEGPPDSRTEVEQAKAHEMALAGTPSRNERIENALLTYNQGIPGLLVWPQRNFYRFGGQPVELQSLIKPSITPEQVLTLLREAKDKGVELSVSLHLRGVDGPGSSLDLPEFQLMLTPPGTSDLTKLPSTSAIASAFRVKMIVSLAANPEAIEYVAPDYGIPADHPDTATLQGKTILLKLGPLFDGGRIPDGVKDSVAQVLLKALPVEGARPVFHSELRDDGATLAITVAYVGPVQLNARGMTPRYYKDAPAFIFRNVFGLKGIRITLEEIPAMAKAGGMESSNAFTVGLIAIASMLSGANLSQAEIFNLAVRLEDVEFGNLTGGQGHLSSIFGGAYRHIWLSGVTDAGGHLLNPYAAFSVSELSRDALDRAAGQMMLAQAGKDYVDGKPKGSRTAGLINFIWTDLLRDRDEVGFALHQEKLGLAARYAKALAEGDFATVVETVNRYVDIRDTLCRRWILLALDAEQGKPGPSYAKNYANKVFHPERANYVSGERPEDFEDIRTRYRELQAEGHVDDLRAISFYTLDPIETLVQEARKEGIAVMPLGAGGPGANLIVISSKPNGQEHLRQFFEKINTHPRFADHPFEALTEARAREIMSGTGTLRGFIPFEVGHEPMQFAGFQQLDTFRQLGLREPAPPRPIGPSAPSSKPKMEVVPKAPAVDPALLKTLRTALEPRNLHEGLQQALQTPPAGQPLRIYHLSPTSLERYATYLQGGFERIAQLPVRATTFVAKKDERREDFEARMRDEAHGEQTDITLIEWHGAETEIPLIEAAYTGRLVVLVHRPEEIILRYGEERTKTLLDRADAVVLLGPSWVSEYERLLPGKVVVAIPHGFFEKGERLDEARLSPDAVAVVGSNTTWGEMRHLEDVLSLKTALDRQISTTGSQARVVAYVAGKFDQRVQGQLYKDRDDVWWLTNHDILTAQQGGAFHDEVSFRSWLYEQAHGRVIVRAHVEDSRVVPESFESREHADLARWEQQLVDFNVQLYHEILKDRRQANPHAPKAEYAGTLHLNGGPAIGVVFDSPTMSDVADYERFQVVRVALQPDGQPVVEGAARDILQLIEEPERRNAVVEANVALADRLRMDEIAYGYYLLSQTLTQRVAQEPVSHSEPTMSQQANVRVDFSELPEALRRDVSLVISEMDPAKMVRELHEALATSAAGPWKPTLNRMSRTLTEMNPADYHAGKTLDDSTTRTADRSGWVDMPDRIFAEAQATVEADVTKMEHAIQQAHPDLEGEPIRYVILPAMGGSKEIGNAINEFVKAAKLATKDRTLFFLDTSGKDGLAGILQQIIAMEQRRRQNAPLLRGLSGKALYDALLVGALERTVVLGISMGMTSEEPVINMTAAAELVFRKAFERADRNEETLKALIGAHFWSMTLDGSTLHEFLKVRGWGEHRLPIQLDGKSTLSGRNSYVSRVALLPLAFLGLSITDYLGAMAAPNFTDADREEAFRLSAVFSAAEADGYSQPMLLLPDEWQPFGFWLRQGNEESLGKNDDHLQKVQVPHRVPWNLLNPTGPKAKQHIVHVKAEGVRDPHAEDVALLKQLGYPVTTVSLRKIPGPPSMRDRFSQMRASDGSTGTALGALPAFLHCWVHTVLGLGHDWGKDTVGQYFVELYKKYVQIFILGAMKEGQFGTYEFEQVNTPEVTAKKQEWLNRPDPTVGSFTQTKVWERLMNSPRRATFNGVTLYFDGMVKGVGHDEARYTDEQVNAALRELGVSGGVQEANAAQLYAAWMVLAGADANITFGGITVFGDTMHTPQGRAAKDAWEVFARDVHGHSAGLMTSVVEGPRENHSLLEMNTAGRNEGVLTLVTSSFEPLLKGYPAPTSDVNTLEGYVDHLLARFPADYLAMQTVATHQSYLEHGRRVVLLAGDVTPEWIAQFHDEIHRLLSSTSSRVAEVKTSAGEALPRLAYPERLRALGVTTQRPEDMGSLQQGFWAPAFPEAVSYTISPDLGAAAADVSRVRRIVIHSSVLATSPVAEIAYQRLQQQLQQVLGEGPRAIDFVIVPNELPEAEQQALIMKPIGTAVFEIAAIIGPKDWATALRKTVGTKTVVVASASEQNGSVPRWEEALIAGVEAAVAADPRLLPIIGRLHVAVEDAEGLFSVEAEPLAMEAVEPEIRQAVLTSRTLAGSK